MSSATKCRLLIGFKPTKRICGTSESDLAEESSDEDTSESRPPPSKRVSLFTPPSTQQTETFSPPPRLSSQALRELASSAILAVTTASTSPQLPSPPSLASSQAPREPTTCTSTQAASTSPQLLSPTSRSSSQAPRELINSNAPASTLTSPQLLSPPSRSSSQALRELANSAVRSPVGLCGTPSRGHNIGPAAVTQILTLLEFVREDNREIKRLLHRVLARGGTTDDQPVQLPEGLTFPIASPDEMEVFDILLEDQTKMASVVRYLSMFGGADMRETVDRIMKETMSTQLARQYNMTGVKGKHKFEPLRLLNVLFSCVKKNSPTRTATRKDVEAEVSRWLYGARDRQGGRKSRHNRTPTQAPAPADEEN